MSDGVLNAENTSYVPLVFERHGSEEWVAPTPMGEIAYGEFQGIYEWRDRQRIDHTGGDQAVIVEGTLLVRSNCGGPARREGLLEACRRAMDRVAVPRRYKEQP